MNANMSLYLIKISTTYQYETHMHDCITVCIGMDKDLILHLNLLVGDLLIYLFIVHFC